jgi:hypothetical protein
MTGVRCKKSGRNSGRRLIVGANEHEALNTSMKPLSMDETKLGEAAAKAMRAQDLLGQRIVERSIQGAGR